MIGIRNALKNQDPEIRGVAADLLAQAGDLDAIPLIRDALRRERAEATRLHFVGALATLKAAEGRPILEAMCRDGASDPVSRLQAAKRLQELGDEACLSSVVQLLSNNPDQPTSVLGVEYLRGTSVAPSSLLPSLRAVLIPELQNPAPIVRQYASECISVFGDKDSVSALREAITAEKDSITRNHLQENLDRLKARLEGKRLPDDLR